MDVKHASSDATALIVQAAEGTGARRSLAADVMHELAANALLDAPVDARGSRSTPTGASRCRRGPRARVPGGHGGGRGGIYLEAVDLFGRLTPGPFARALARWEGGCR